MVDREDTRPASDMHLERALYELAGAASCAALVLEEMAGDNERLYRTQVAKPALQWLERHLGDAAEAAVAIFEQRAPLWDVTGESQDVHRAIEWATARGEERKARLAAMRAAIQQAAE